MRRTNAFSLAVAILVALVLAFKVNLGFSQGATGSIFSEHAREFESNKGQFPFVVTAQGMAQLFPVGEPTLFHCEEDGGTFARKRGDPKEGLRQPRQTDRAAHHR